MSIIVWHELLQPHCDICGTFLASEKSEADARAAMERAGWETQKVQEGAVRETKDFLLVAPDTIDACALCVRLGKRYEDKPKPKYAAPPPEYNPWDRRNRKDGEI